MFNPYNVQGGTATIDPQFSGMNGQSRIPDVISSTYPQYAQQTGVFPVPGIHPTFAPFANYAPNYSNYVPQTQAYGWNTAPSSFVAPTAINPYACQPTVGAFPTTHYGIPSVYPMTNPFAAWNPVVPQVTPFGNIPTFAGYHPMTWANPAVNPFAGVVNPFTGVSINPFTGQPIVVPQQNMLGWPVSTPFGVPQSVSPVVNPIAAINQAVTAQLGLTNPYNTVASPIVQNILRSIQSPFAAWNPLTALNPFVTNPWSNIASLASISACGHPMNYAPWVNPSMCGIYGCNPMNYGSLTFGNPISSFPTIGGYSFPGSINSVYGNPLVNSLYQTNPAAIFNPASAWFNQTGFSPIGTTIGCGTTPFFGATTPTIASALNNAACWPSCLN